MAGNQHAGNPNFGEQFEPSFVTLFVTLPLPYSRNRSEPLILLGKVNVVAGDGIEPTIEFHLPRPIHDRVD